MRKAATNAARSGGGLDTLAQKRTRGAVLIHGLGTDLTDKKALQNRARRKQLSQVIAAKLADLAKKDGNEKLRKAFWNTYHCLEKVYVADGRLHGNYCKNRVCTICLCIRKAEKINRYYPEISTWKDAQFVTITIRAVPAKKLKPLMENIILGFNRIVETCRKRAKRGDGQALIGVRSMECNFNPKRRTYNPHFHLIVKNRRMADIIVSEWLKRAKDGWVSPKAQKISSVKDGAKSVLKEIIKYGSKIVTENNVDKKIREKVSVRVYAKALYTIIKAMDGKRIFDRFGFNLPETNSKEVPAKVAVDYDEFSYDLHQLDWIDYRTGEKLTNYEPDAELNYVLNHCIDIEMN